MGRPLPSPAPTYFILVRMDSRKMRNLLNPQGTADGSTGLAIRKNPFQAQDPLVLASSSLCFKAMPVLRHWPSLASRLAIELRSTGHYVAMIRAFQARTLTHQDPIALRELCFTERNSGSVTISLRVALWGPPVPAELSGREKCHAYTSQLHCYLSYHSIYIFKAQTNPASGGVVGGCCWFVIGYCSPIHASLTLQAEAPRGDRRTHTLRRETQSKNAGVL